jgi:hypothetical protein
LGSEVPVGDAVRGRTLSEQVEAHINGCHHNDVDGAVCVGCSLLQEQQTEIEKLLRVYLDRNGNPYPLYGENQRLRALLRQAAMFVAKWSVEEREDAPGVKAAGALLDQINEVLDRD